MSALHMVSLPVALEGFRRWMAGRGLAADEGRALHHLLSESFGKGVLQPFRLMVGKDARQATLYAYTQADQTALRQTASETGMPDALALIDLSDLRTKPMPDVWKEGRRFAFDVRVRPVRRLLKPLEAPPRSMGDAAAGGAAAKPFRKGAEVDAFLVAALRDAADGESGAPDAPPGESPGEPTTREPMTREAVYRRWLTERLAGAARLDGASLARMERTRIARTKTAEGPDAVFHGELTVTDGDAFARMLAKGVGRHTAYGYGMLLLRPARDPEKG